MNLRVPEDLDWRLEKLAAEEHTCKFALLLQGAELVLQRHARRREISEGLDFVMSHDATLPPRVAGVPSWWTVHNARSAVVTGGGSGIGEAIALKLGKAGYAVTIGDIGEAAADVAAKITAGGGQAQFVPADVIDEDSVRGLMEAAAATFGGLDILVANAGIPEEKAPVHELDLAQWRRVLDVNLTGVALCNKWAVATMLESRRQGAGPRAASVINMASILAHVGQANSNAYSASKAAVVNFTRSAALTYAKEGIRFNAVSPGYVDTPLLAQLPEETRSQMIAKQPIGRLLRPEEIANVVLFLAGEGSSALTGSVINADGGYTAV